VVLIWFPKRFLGLLIPETTKAATLIEFAARGFLMQSAEVLSQFSRSQSAAAATVHQ
jgi:hypothetical protein